MHSFVQDRTIYGVISLIGSVRRMGEEYLENGKTDLIRQTVKLSR